MGCRKAAEEIPPPPFLVSASRDLSGRSAPERQPVGPHRHRYGVAGAGPVPLPVARERRLPRGGARDGAQCDETRENTHGACFVKDAPLLQFAS